MNVSISRLAGLAALLAIGTADRAAHADMIWVQETAANANTGRPVQAISIAVTPTNVPYIVEAVTGSVYYLGANVVCNGLCTLMRIPGWPDGRFRGRPTGDSDVTRRRIPGRPTADSGAPDG